MSLVDKWKWSHHQWNMLLIQSRFTCTVRAWPIMLLKHLIKSSLGPSIHYITHVGHVLLNSHQVSSSFWSELRPPRTGPPTGQVFVLQLLLCLIKREVGADDGSAGCVRGMTDYSTSSAAPHHLLQKSFRAISPQNQRCVAIREEWTYRLLLSSRGPSD